MMLYELKRWIRNSPNSKILIRHVYLSEIILEWQKFSYPPKLIFLQLWYIDVKIFWFKMHYVSSCISDLIPMADIEKVKYMFY